ncbi:MULTISPECIES: hypothetical protein [Streptomyces]|uniref:hypothetical protein n=1 Tax=Streptomyces TaxID=1883 RepID=UPI001C48DB61|nr:hypothetical protein [Streptomyces albidoflavus]MBV7653668.1 hypothetical protein [Streptomyces albidoflavus]MBV7714199.1 hypothetical protein [Streptomyces albidoflavus]
MSQSSSPIPPAAPLPDTRWGPTHALILLIAIFTFGTLLFREGTTIGAILSLLGGCGAIGAGTLGLAGGGRRLIAALAEVAVRSGADR